jgi:hypothetical protein
MRYAPTSWAAALALVLLSASPSRADFIHWTYSWSNSPSEIIGDAGSGKIALSNENPTNAVNNTDVVATNLHTFSTAPRSNPDVFTAKPYALTLNLTDQDSGATGTLTFTGQFDGTLTAGSSNLKNTFTGATEQSVVLGTHLYTALIGQYSPPGPPDSSNAGSISAHATIEVQQVIEGAPEPSTLMLLGLGLPLASLGLWHRRYAASSRR